MSKRIIRVFPTKTSHTPTDEYSFYDVPGFFIPKHDEVHISVCFTWDLERAAELKWQWGGRTSRPIIIGGPACEDPGGEFTPGLYLKKGITITSRGCGRRCKFCLVPKREGRIRELEVHPGNIIQDNNFLACSERHRKKVFDMLSDQGQIVFSGGLESRLITKKIARTLSHLRIKELWLACDRPNDIIPLKKAINILKEAGFSSRKIRVYVLIGFDLLEEENRLKEIYRSGGMPFAQLYRNEFGNEYKKYARNLAKVWSRPAIYKTIMKEEVA